MFIFVEAEENQTPKHSLRLDWVEFHWKKQEGEKERDNIAFVIVVETREQKKTTYEANMGFSCSSSTCKPFNSTSPILSVNNLTKRPFFLNTKKGKIHHSPQRPKVVAFYGLTPPPYKLDALEPYMSKRTVKVHWGELHHGYVEGLNKLLEKDDVLYGYTLEELVKVSYNNGNPLPEFNTASQVWNHDFFWESMQPDGGRMPGEVILPQIEKDFGSFTNFRENFVEAALTLFGSGWIWLVLKTKEKRLEVVKTTNAVNPLISDDIPLLCLDMWEHAYYLDYKNDKGRYVNDFLDHLVSWHTATARMARAESFINLGEPNIPVA